MIDFKPNINLLLSVARGGSLLANLTSAIRAKYRISNADTGMTVFEPSGVESFEYDGQSSISTVPIERGSFSSFNKVIRPSALDMVFLVNSLTGLNASIPDIGSFTFTSQRDNIAILDQMKRDATLYNIETPKAFFNGYALVSFDFGVTPVSGVQLLRIFARFEQVLEIAEVTISSPAAEEKPTDNAASASASAATEQVQASTQSPASSILAAGRDGISKLKDTATGAIGTVASALPSALNTVTQPLDILKSGSQLASNLNADALKGLVA